MYVFNVVEFNDKVKLMDVLHCGFNIYSQISL